MIIGIKESKTLMMHVSCECKCNKSKFDGRKCNSYRKWNNDKCLCECENLKEHHMYKKGYIWNPAICSCENGKYLASIIDHSVNTCDEIRGETKTIPINFNEKRLIVK